jgi:betaine-aldehyde dehydrogenase
MPSRLLVERSVYDRVVEGVHARAQEVVVGGPFDPGVTMGPVISEASANRIIGMIDEATASGAGQLLCGGHRMGGELADGFFVEPTIFVDVDNRARIAQEEIFGPVLTVIPFDQEEDAIRIANDTPFGLAGAVWTRDVYRGIRVLKQIRAGILWLNTYHPTYNEAPWGGYKQSGIGRELGPYGLEAYLETKQINVNLTDAPIGWY